MADQNDDVRALVRQVLAGGDSAVAPAPAPAESTAVPALAPPDTTVAAPQPPPPPPAPAPQPVPAPSDTRSLVRSILAEPAAPPTAAAVAPPEPAHGVLGMVGNMAKEFGNDVLAAPRAIGLDVQSIAKNIEALPHSLSELQQPSQRQLGARQEAAGLTQQAGEQGTRALAAGLSIGAGQGANVLVKAALGKAVSPVASFFARRAVEAAEGSAALGTYTGIREGKPVDGLITGAALGVAAPAALRGASSAVRILRDSVARPVAQLFGNNPVVQRVVAQPLRAVQNAAHVIFGSGETRLRRLGLNDLADNLMETRQKAVLLSGGFNADYEATMRGLTKTERHTAVAIVEGNVNPQALGALVAPARQQVVTDAAARFENQLRDAGAMLRDAFVPVYNEQNDAFHDFQLRDDFFPHRIVNTEQYTVPGPIQDEAIKALLKAGRVASRQEGIDWLENFHAEAESGDSGLRSSTLKARTVNLPGYEQDPDLVMPQYFDFISRRITLAEEFGEKAAGKPPLTPQQLQQIGQGAPSPLSSGLRASLPRMFESIDALPDPVAKQTAEQLVLNYFGVAKRPSFFLRSLNDALLRYQVVTKLARAAVPQLSQLGSSYAKTGDAVQAFGNVVKLLRRDPEAWEFALRSGAIVKEAIGRSNEALTSTFKDTSTSQFLRKVGFTQSDTFARAFASLQGAGFARVQARKLVSISDDLAKLTNPLVRKRVQESFDRIAERLTHIGIDPQQVIASRGALNDDQLLRAGSSVAFETNFWGDSLNLPQAFSSSELKAVLQFKSFAFQQFRFLRKEIVAPAMDYLHSGGSKGDIVPMVRLLVASQVLGEAVSDIRSIITNRSRPPDGFHRVMDNWAQGAFLGVLSDATTAIERGGLGTLSFIVGPTLSDIGQLAEGFASAKKTGDASQLGRVVLRGTLPIVHPLLSVATPAIVNYLLPTKTNPPYVSTGGGTKQRTLRKAAK